jgi:hypothetical protein
MLLLLVRVFPYLVYQPTIAPSGPIIPERVEKDVWMALPDAPKAGSSSPCLLSGLPKLFLLLRLPGLSFRLGEAVREQL